MRRLARTVMTGGVVYPAGTREDDIEGGVQRDDVWEDVDIDVPEAVREIDESDHPITVDVREACEYLVERHLADKDVDVATLLVGALEVFAPEPAADGQPGTEDDEGDDEGDSADSLPQAPAKSASKPDWVAYATHEAHGEAALTEEAAKAMTRDQLADRFADTSGGDA